jgi:uncharacterized membrane protein YeaQ/YmgE (transglycosylase-associated protein family)
MCPSTVVTGLLAIRISPAWSLPKKRGGVGPFFESGDVVTILDLVILLIIAAVCGSLGMAISGYSRGGCLVAIALGFIGALIGAWIARALSLPELFSLDIGDVHFPIVWSIIGSALFVAVLGFLGRASANNP